MPTKRLRRRATVVAAAVGLLGALCAATPRVLELDEQAGLATLFAVRGPLPAPPEVAVVSISRDAANALGERADPAEWSRSLHADLIDALSAAGAAAIVFDIRFEKPRDDAGDRRLAAAVRAAGNVVLLEEVMSDKVTYSGVRGEREVRVPPLPELEAAALATAPFVLPAVPIRVSQFWTFGRAADETASLPATALQAYLRADLPAFYALLERARPAFAERLRAARASRDFEREMLTLRAIVRPDRGLQAEVRAALGAAGPRAAALASLLDLYAGDDSRYVNYYGPPQTIATLPFDRVLREPATLDVAGKVLFVGFSESRQPEQRDAFYSVFSERSGANLSGVEIGATAFANLLERRTVRPLGMPLHFALLLAWAIVLAGALGWLPATRAVLAAAVAGAAYFGIAWAAFAHDVWLPLLVPLAVQLPVALVAFTVLRQRDLARQRARIQTALGYYVPAGAVRKLAERSASVESERSLLHGTCLCTDAENYTTVSEALRPDELTELMNDYFGTMFRVVAKHGGFVSDTSGDSMVAVWTTASPDAAVRGNACAAAVELLQAVEAFNRDRGERRLPTRVGLESGELMLGNVGAEQRFEYRAIGDIVNTASRIQGLNAQLGTRLLVSADTLAGVAGIPGRDLGRFRLRGKTAAVRVYEPLAMLPPQWDSARLAAEFAAALGDFTEQRWHAAADGFGALLQRYPGDGPSAYFLDLCRGYGRAPPVRWDGVVTIATK